MANCHAQSNTAMKTAGFSQGYDFKAFLTFAIAQFGGEQSTTPGGPVRAIIASLDSLCEVCLIRKLEILSLLQNCVWAIQPEIEMLLDGRAMELNRSEARSV
jgi:hypothetical protein